MPRRSRWTGRARAARGGEAPWVGDPARPGRPGEGGDDRRAIGSADRRVVGTSGPARRGARGACRGIAGPGDQQRQPGPSDPRAEAEQSGDPFARRGNTGSSRSGHQVRGGARTALPARLAPGTREGRKKRSGRRPRRNLRRINHLSYQVRDRNQPPVPPTQSRSHRHDGPAADGRKNEPNRHASSGRTGTPLARKNEPNRACPPALVGVAGPTPDGRKNEPNRRSSRGRGRSVGLGKNEANPALRGASGRALDRAWDGRKNEPNFLASPGPGRCWAARPAPLPPSNIGGREGLDPGFSPGTSRKEVRSLALRLRGPRPGEGGRAIPRDGPGQAESPEDPK